MTVMGMIKEKSTQKKTLQQIKLGILEANIWLLKRWIDHVKENLIQHAAQEDEASKQKIEEKIRKAAQQMKEMIDELEKDPILAMAYLS